MDEYISKKALLKAIEGGLKMSICDDNKVICDICGERFDINNQQICCPKCADVQPIKHGRWEYYKNNGIIDTYICTNCQSKVEMTIDVEPSKFKYCPNCGAKMDVR